MSKKPAINVQRLIRIVNNIETKVVFSQTAISLEELINNYLVKAISLFMFDSVELREKLNKLINMFFVRIKSDDAIKLPTKNILNLMLKQRKNPFVLNISKLFFNIAFDRDPNKEECLESLFVGCSSLPKDLRLNMVYRVLVIIHKLSIPEQPEKRRSFFKIFLENKNDRETLLNFFLKLLFTTTKKEWTEIVSEKIESYSEIHQMKLTIATFICQSGIPFSEIFPHVIIGASENQRKISSLCEEFMKKHRVDETKKEIVRTLYRFFFALIPEQKRPATENEKRIIMKYLCRSISATRDYKAARRVLKETLFDYQVSHRLRVQGLEFMNICLRNGFRDLSTIAKEEDNKSLRAPKEETEGEEEEEEEIPVVKRQPKLILDFIVKGDKQHILLVFKDFVSMIRDILSGEEVLRKSRGYELVKFKESIFPVFANFLKLFPEFIDHMDKMGYDLIDLFFSEMKDESPQVKLVIQQTLGILMFPYRFYLLHHQDPKVTNVLMNMLRTLFRDIIINSKYFDDDEIDKSRENLIYSALFCVNRLFPFGDPTSRILNLYQVSHTSLQIREEAKRGISIKSFKSKYRTYMWIGKMEVKVEYPDFCDFVTEAKNFVVKEGGFADESIVALCQFTREMLVAKAEKMGVSIRQYLMKKDGADFSVNVLLELLFQGLNQTATVIREISKLCLFLIKEDRKSFTLKLTRFLPRLEKFLFSGDSNSRSLIAKLFSFVSVNKCLVDDGEKDRIYREILVRNLKTRKDPNPSNLQSAILLTSYFISFWYQKQKSVEKEMRHLIDLVLLSLTHQNQMISLASCQSLGYLALNNVLQTVWSEKKDEVVPNEEKKEKTEEVLFKEVFEVMKILREESTRKRRKIGDLQSLVSVLLVHLNIVRTRNLELRGTSKPKIPKLEEGIINTLGKICHNSCIPVIFDACLDELYKYRYSKNPELQFVVGECLSCLCGFTKLFEDDEFITRYQENPKELELRKKYLNQILTFVVKNGALSPQSIVRQNTSIWLVSIVKFCQKSPILQDYVHDLQEAFSRLISDHTNRITSSAASRGLTYVYQMGDSKLQEQLVRSLMDTFRGKNDGYKGELLIIKDMDYSKKGGGDPKHGGEEKKEVPNSYKDLVRIADDLGDSTLIYKFLNISNQNRIWNSKRAAAFSTLTILQNTDQVEEMKKIFPKIFPKLFVYQFDPNKDVSGTMGDMIVQYSEMENKSIPELIDQYIQPVISEIQRHLLEKYWRNREASIRALAVLLSYAGRTFDEFESSLIEILKKLFKLTDDLKESVAKCATKVLFGDVSRFLVKCLNWKHRSTKRTSKSLKRCVDLIFPFLLREGLQGAQFIKIFSLNVLMKGMNCYKDEESSSSSGPQSVGSLRLMFSPYIAELIEHLLHLMTNVENTDIQGLGHQVEQFGVSREQFDELRVRVSDSLHSSQSVVNDTMSICIRFVNKSNLSEIVRRLILLIQNSTGMLSRVHTIRVVSTIAKNNQKDFTFKQTTGLLHTIFSKLFVFETTTSLSMSEKKEMANCVSYLLNSASKKRKREIINEKIFTYYFLTDQNFVRRISGSEASVESKISRIVARMVNSINIRAYSVFESDLFYPRFIQIIYFGRLTPRMIIRQEQNITKTCIHNNNFDQVVKYKKLSTRSENFELVDSLWVSPSLPQTTKRDGRSDDAMVDEDEEDDELRDDTKIFRKLWKEQLLDSETRTIEKYFPMILQTSYDLLDHRTYGMRIRGALGLLFCSNLMFENSMFSSDPGEVYTRKTVVEMIEKVLTNLKKSRMLFSGKEYIVKLLGILCSRYPVQQEKDQNTIFFKVIDFVLVQMEKRRKKKSYLLEMIQTFQLILLNQEIMKTYFCEEKKYYSKSLFVLDDILVEMRKKEQEMEQEMMKDEETSQRKVKVKKNLKFKFSDNQSKSIVLKIEDRVKVKILESYGLIFTHFFPQKDEVVPYLEMMRDFVGQKFRSLKSQKITNSERFGNLFSFSTILNKLAVVMSYIDTLGDEKKVELKKKVVGEIMLEMKEMIVFNMKPENVSFVTRKGCFKIFHDLFVPFCKKFDLIGFKNQGLDIGGEEEQEGGEGKYALFFSDFDEMIRKESNHQLKDSIERLKNQILVQNSFDE